MDYYFGEHLRWNLGWATPNQGGAFVATLIPWVWALLAWFWGRWRAAATQRERIGWALAVGCIFAFEALGTYALARTYSRGALVALVIGAVTWGGMAWWRSRRASVRGNPANTRPPVGPALGASAAPWLGRGLLLAICLAVTGFHSRMAPEHLVEDRSSLNRLVLWRGGAELVAASPLRGWGWGQSGASFMHWTQPLDRSEGYLSMVNSYLTVAVEAGLPLFALILTLALLPLARSLGRARPLGSTDLVRVNFVLLAAAASWATWLACLVFSNLWIIRGLWLVPALAAVALLAFRPHSAVGWARAFAGSAGVAVVACLALWFAGSVWAKREQLLLHRAADGSVSLTALSPTATTPANPARHALVWVVPDVEVLGESYGQELRRWLLADQRLREIRVFGSAENLPLHDLAMPSAVLLCGAAVEQAGAPGVAGVTGPVWLLHPTVPPLGKTPSWPAGSRVVLPGIDVAGHAAAWWPWAAQASPPILVSLSSGLASDVRPRWPEIALAWPLSAPR